MAGGEVAEGAQEPPAPEAPDEGRSVVFREDDAAYKERLKRDLTNHWLVNTTVTFILFTSVFYLITRNPIIGVLGGLLVLGVSNLYVVLLRVREFERWEVFSNGVRLGYDPQGRSKFIKFSEITDIQIRPGLVGESFIIHMGRRRLRYRYEENREVLDLLRKRYIAYTSIHGEGEVPGDQVGG
jgi:hypothetical protein